MIGTDEADLALLEANGCSELVQALIWRIRQLEDELWDLCAAIAEADESAA